MHGTAASTLSSDVRAQSEPALRVVHLAQSDREGGANRAAYRLHAALRAAGVNSTFHCGRKLGTGPDIVEAAPPFLGRRASSLAAYLNARALRAYPQRLPTAFSPVKLCYGRLDMDLLARADVVCVHWIAGAFLTPAALARIGRPLVWRLSDLWPFTGGCHYPGQCRRFESECGCCPVLDSSREADLSRDGFRAREQAYRNLDLTVVAPSRWIGEHARRSRLFGGRRIEHIRTGVDLTVFRPHDRSAARASLGLPSDRTLILFGAFAATADRRKGFHHLKAALHAFARSKCPDRPTVVVFGAPQDASCSDELPLPTISVGRIEEEDKLARLFAAADVFVAPFAEDNLPNVILEALACGTPVVAFAAGGIPEAVDHQRNGFLAPVGDAAQLGRGIAWLLSDTSRLDEVRRAARETAEARFDLVDCTRRYEELFTDIAAKHRGAEPERQIRYSWPPRASRQSDPETNSTRST